MASGAGRALDTLRRHGVVAAALAAAWLALGGLGATACAGGGCDLNSDCLYAYCVDGECKQDCRQDLDCPLGLVCNSSLGRCDPPAASGGSGATDGGDAAGGVGGTTGGTGGLGGADGGSGGATGGSGGATGGSGGATGGSGGATGGSGGATGGSGGATGGTGGSGGTGGVGTRLELDVCTTDGECAAGLLCRPFGLGNATRCTRECSQVGFPSECPSGERCETTAGGTYCTPGDVGATCGAASDCLYACLQPANYCTSLCATAADCPAGFGCGSISGTRVCLRTAQYCDQTTLCGSGLCDQSLVVSGCTVGCSSAADCPQRAQGLTPWTCQGGNCLRPGDVYGPVQGGDTTEYYCDGSSNIINLCNDGLHIDFVAGTTPNPPAVDCQAPTSTTGVGNDTCVDTCRYAGGCPAGMACVGLANLGSARAGLCVPRGYGEVGAACSYHGDCLFGYCRGSGASKTCSRDCSRDGLCPTGSTCVPGAGVGEPTQVEGLQFKRCE